jgi:MFS transporter, PAT family, beta-lactamase induction signal transducer AmpG
MLTKKTFLIVWLLGLMSGFTIMITGNTLNFWLSIENLDIRTIGIFAIVTLPYALNFIWAPIFDIVKIPIFNNIFGQRLSWVITLQIFLSAAIYLMSKFNPTEEIFYVASAAILVSFLASSQDAALGGIRSELVKKDDQIAISGMYIFGYRIGMVMSNAGAIFVSQYMNWNLVYELFSLIVVIFPISLILLSKHIRPEPFKFDDSHNLILENNKNKFKSFISIISKITKPIGSPKYIALILIFLVLYRLPDNFISMMINPFLIHIGYPAATIATAGKLFGTISALIGGLLGSYIMRKKNIFDSLLLFGSIHAVAHILFVIQDIYGQNIYLLFIVTGFESISGGITMTAYIAFIATLCDGKFRSTQYAFFTSMMGLSRSVFPALSGYMVANLGWTVFFLFTTVATVPALIIILYLEKIHNKKDQKIS